MENEQRRAEEDAISWERLKEEGKAKPCSHLTPCSHPNPSSSTRTGHGGRLRFNAGTSPGGSRSPQESSSAGQGRSSLGGSRCGPLLILTPSQTPIMAREALEELEKEVNSAARPHPVAGFRWKEDFTPFEGAEVSATCHTRRTQHALFTRLILPTSSPPGAWHRTPYGRGKKQAPLPPWRARSVASSALSAPRVLGRGPATAGLGAIGFPCTEPQIAAAAGCGKRRSPGAPGAALGPPGKGIPRDAGQREHRVRLFHHRCTAPIARNDPAGGAEEGTPQADAHQP